MRLFHWAAQVSKVEGAITTHSMVAGWRRADTEATVRGIAFQAAQEAKPGFSVDQIIVAQIPETD